MIRGLLLLLLAMVIVVAVIHWLQPPTWLSFVIGLSAGAIAKEVDRWLD